MTANRSLIIRSISALAVTLLLGFSFRSMVFAQSQANQNQSALVENQKLKEQLDKVFRKALDAEQSEAAKEALIASQRAWQLYCDADGHYESVATGPASARTSYVNGRMSHLIRIRLYHLQTSTGEGWMEPYPEKK